MMIPALLRQWFDPLVRRSRDNQQQASVAAASNLTRGLERHRRGWDSFLLLCATAMLRFGTLSDFDELIVQAHTRGLAAVNARLQIAADVCNGIDYQSFVDALDPAELVFDWIVPDATRRPSYRPSALIEFNIYSYLNRI